MSIYIFIHSFRPFLYRPFKSSTTQRRSRLEHGYCIGVSRQSAQATAGKGLARGPYMAARAGVELTTLRLRVIASTNAPLCPICLCLAPARRWPQCRGNPLHNNAYARSLSIVLRNNRNLNYFVDETDCLRAAFNRHRLLPLPSEAVT